MSTFLGEDQSRIPPRWQSGLLRFARNDGEWAKASPSNSYPASGKRAADSRERMSASIEQARTLLFPGDSKQLVKGKGTNVQTEGFHSGAVRLGADRAARACRRQSRRGARGGDRHARSAFLHGLYFAHVWLHGVRHAVCEGFQRRDQAADGAGLESLGRWPDLQFHAARRFEVA